MCSFPPCSGGSKLDSVASDVLDEIVPYNTAVMQMAGSRYGKGGEVLWHCKIPKYEQSTDRFPQFANTWTDMLFYNYEV
jgi:hypothetical protein